MTQADASIPDDAGLLEWVDARRANAERARDIAMGVCVVVPIALIVVVARVAFAGSKAGWLGPTAIGAGVIFVTGLAASVVLGVRSWLRTRAFVRAIEAGLPGLTPTTLADGEPVGELLTARHGAGLTLAHRWSVGRLRATRITMCVLALLTGAGAGVLVAMLVGQGSINLRGWIGLVGLAATACGAVAWVLAFRKPLAIRLDFDAPSRTLTLVNLVGVTGLRTVDAPFTAIEGLSFDQSDLLDTQRVALVIAGRRFEIARFAAPRGNLSKRKLMGVKRAAADAHRALCGFRAERLVLTIEEAIAEPPTGSGSESARDLNPAVG